ncbi:hypothetical protein DFQ27_006317 [Actinomortierella ambigua]|uniref:Mid2 domain-containing protein n=1 Tax=Actinomortierella ambigua TaxID=1343610 RepID=A0A9P6PZQ0_9FUNG|nr:hypothetical protein DFQ27_006317 [Actinomortierella ambigua]
MLIPPHTPPSIRALGFALLALCCVNLGVAQSPVNAAGMAFAKTKTALYYSGGFVDVPTLQFTNQFYKLDLTVAWTSIMPAWKRLANGPSSGNFAAAFSANEKTMATFHSAGGLPGGAFAWLYSVDSDTWTKSKIQVDVPDKAGVPAVTNPLNNRVYFPLTFFNKPGTDVYDFSTDSIITVPPTFTGVNTPGGTFLPAMWSAYLKSVIYFGVGGNPPGNLPVTAYDPATGSYKTLIYNLDLDQWVDKYTPPAPNVPPSKPGNNTGANPGGNPGNNTGGNSGSNPGNNPDVNPDNNLGGTKEETNNVGLIAGVSAAVVILLVAGIIGVFVYRRRLRRRKGAEGHLHDTGKNGGSKEEKTFAIGFRGDDRDLPQPPSTRAETDISDPYRQPVLGSQHVHQPAHDSQPMHRSVHGSQSMHKPGLGSPYMRSPREGYDETQIPVTISNHDHDYHGAPQPFDYSNESKATMGPSSRLPDIPQAPRTRGPRAPQLFSDSDRRNVMPSRSQHPHAIIGNGAEQ